MLPCAPHVERLAFGDTHAPGNPMPSAGRYTFRAHLIAFALLVSLPVTVLAGVLLIHSANGVRRDAEMRILRLAEALSENFDRDVERHLLVLNTLSTLPSFQEADWPTFYTQASTALRGDGYIVLADSSFRQLVNTHVAYGREPERTGDLETARRVAASKRPEVSSVFTSLVTGGPVVNFDMPIMRDGELQYILMYGRPVDHLAATLDGQSLDPSWTTSVFDRHGALIAASPRRAPATTGAGRGRVTAAPPIGLSRYSDAADSAILRAAHVSDQTGWTVTIDTPLFAVNREINTSLGWWAIFAAATLLLAVGLGVLFGQFLSRQLGRAAAYATAVGREEPAPALGRTTLKEIGLIAEALGDARIELARRMEHQRTLSRELNHRVKNLLAVVQAVISRTFADTRPLTQSRELAFRRLQALARAQDLLTRSDWKDLPLRQIVDMEVSSFAERIDFDGPNVLVSSTSVQNLALVLHELMTNAVKYGALRDNAGTIKIRWSVEGVSGAERFTFMWKEHCAHIAATSLQPSGFGATLLKSAFYTADTTYRLEIEPDGLVYELAAPLRAVTGSEWALGVEPTDSASAFESTAPLRPIGAASPPQVRLEPSPP